MNVPADLKYTASHEWVRSETDGTITTGITDHAQQALGDLVFIELPRSADRSRPAKPARSSNRSRQPPTSTPRSAGVVLAVNDAVVAAPEKINADAYGNWLYRLKPANPGDVGQAARRSRLHRGRGRILIDRRTKQWL